MQIPAFRFFRAAFLLALTVPALAGCGGGGGQGGDGAAPPPVASQLRSNEPGDHFGYEVGGTIRATDGSGDSSNITGTATVDYTAAPMQSAGRAVIKETMTSRLRFDAGAWFQPGDVVQLFTFDPTTHDEYLVADYDDSGTQYLLESPVRYAPGTFAAGTQFHQTGRFSDGSSADVRFTVVGREVVSVPAGRFATWRCARVMDGTTTTEWYAPQIGAPVKLHFEGTSDGAFTSLDFKMNDTNIPH